MTFLRAWGLMIVVTVWLCALMLGAAALLISLVFLVPVIWTGRIYVQEMREWHRYGHPRNRRRAS